MARRSLLAEPSASPSPAHPRVAPRRWCKRINDNGSGGLAGGSCHARLGVIGAYDNWPQHRRPRLWFSGTHGALPLNRDRRSARPRGNRYFRGDSPALVTCRPGRQVGDRALRRDTCADGSPTRSGGKTPFPRKRYGRQRDTELSTEGAVGGAVAARSAPVVGPVHLERNAAARGLERGIVVPGYVALRHPACQRGVDSQCRVSGGDLRRGDAHIPAPARMLSARGATGRVDLYLRRVHERPSRTPRSRPGHELHSLDVACGP